MVDKIKAVLDKVLSVELSRNNESIFYKANIKLIMNSEIDFSLSEEYDKTSLHFQKDDDITVKLKTEECCYVFQEKCTYIKNGHLITLSVRSPHRLLREQNRKFVRASLERPITIFTVEKNEKKTIAELTANNFSIQINTFKTIDISGGGLAFYSNSYIKPGAYIIINLDFISLDNDKCRQKAKVMRCSKVKNSKDLYSIGTEFIDIAFPVREKINRFVFSQIRKNAKKKAEQKT